jgi:hypothetical protein
VAVGREPFCNLCPELHCNTREEHRDTPGEGRRYRQPVEDMIDVKLVEANMILIFDKITWLLFPCICYF